MCENMKGELMLSSSGDTLQSVISKINLINEAQIQPHH